MTLSELNALDHEKFAAALGWIFEGSPWVAAFVWDQRPFASIDALHGAMVEVVESVATAEQIALLRAHPDLGTRAIVSDASKAEQAGAGLDRVTPRELNRFSELNAAYRARFGFPFLYAVKGSDKHDLLHAMEQRLGSSYDDEFNEGLRQVYRIARFRLEKTIS